MKIGSKTAITVPRKSLKSSTILYIRIEIGAMVQRKPFLSLFAECAKLVV
jgi:hypothetical protein